MVKKTKYKNLAIFKLSKIVHLLGKILGLVIKEQEGISFFNKIEKICFWKQIYFLLDDLQLHLK